MFESVDARTDGRRLESHTISSPSAFGSGELKKKFDPPVIHLQFSAYESGDSLFPISMSPTANL